MLLFTNERLQVPRKKGEIGYPGGGGHIYSKYSINNSKLNQTHNSFCGIANKTELQTKLCGSGLSKKKRDRDGTLEIPPPPPPSESVHEAPLASMSTHSPRKI